MVVRSLECLNLEQSRSLPSLLMLLVFSAEMVSVSLHNVPHSGFASLCGCIAYSTFVYPGFPITGSWP